MKTLAFFALVIVAAVTGQTTINPATAEVMAQVHRQVESLFSGVDIDHDGFINLDDMRSIFTDFDENGDQTVSRSEFVDRFAGNSAFMRPVALGLFFDLDMDKNGQLDPADIPLYFDKIDTNDDGRIDHMEFVNYFTQLLEVLFIVALEAEGAITTQAPA